MNVGNNHIALNSVQRQPQAATLKPGQSSVSQSPVISSNTASAIQTNSDPGLKSTSRVNDPLNPEKLTQADNRTQTRAQKTGPANPASVSSSAQSVKPSSQSEPQVQTQVNRLAQIDREVRDHEAAHAAAGGGLTGAPSYSYTRGPDGQLYATGGEVSIDTSRAGDPVTSIQNARTVLKAALAPANPSSQDLRVAAQARAQLIDAQAELNRNEQQASEEASSRFQGNSQLEPNSSEQARSEQTANAQRLATDEASEMKKEERDAEQQEPKVSGFQQNQDELQRRQARIQQKQLEFAQEMAELNLRIQQVQQQLIETGQVDPGSLLQGTLVDTQA